MSAGHTPRHGIQNHFSFEESATSSDFNVNPTLITATMVVASVAISVAVGILFKPPLPDKTESKRVVLAFGLLLVSKFFLNLQPTEITFSDFIVYHVSY